VHDQVEFGPVPTISVAHGRTGLPARANQRAEEVIGSFPSLLDWTDQVSPGGAGNDTAGVC
jgi:hypothetical protein